MDELILSRKVYFCCAYEAEHLEGHNFTLEAFFSGPMDPVTGLVINFSDLDPLLKKCVDQLDHRHLNRDLAYFQEQTPGPKSILHFCAKQILSQWPKDSLVQPIKLKLTQGEESLTDLILTKDKTLMRNLFAL